MFTDTHCHIHEESYADREAAYQRAREAGVDRVICVGTDIQSSRDAVAFALTHDNAWAIIGIHPHEAKRDGARMGELADLLEDPASRERIVGIGEVGLDYFYNHSPREVQIDILKAHLELATEWNLPMSFHVREAFEDFWPIYDGSSKPKGVLHSFTDTHHNLREAISRSLYIGVNGIATFAKDKHDMYRSVPLENLVLETDAPFLTPVPLRGKVNEPAFVTHVAKFLSDLHSVSLEELSVATQRNATTLFLNK